MTQPFAAIARLAAAPIVAAAFLAAALAPAPAQPVQGYHEADVSFGTLPFVPGQTFTYNIPKAIPDSATQVLVVAMFACTLVPGQIQDGERIAWTLWTPIVHLDKSPGKASFQHLMWCAPGQFTTNQSMGWLPINATSRTIYAKLENTDAIPWDLTSSVVKIVSYQ